MRAVFVKANKDMRRRRLQAAVIFVTMLLAVGTATMALTLISQTTNPYHAAFAAQRGAHLRVVYDGKADAGLLAATGLRIGAAATSGPYRTTDIQFETGGHKYMAIAVGREDPNADVGVLRVAAGRWPAAGNEIALTRSFVEVNHVSLGDRLKVTSVPDEPVFTVVAEVVDIDEARADIASDQEAWVVESALPALIGQGSSSYQMNYRFASDPTAAQLQAATETLRAGLPPGSITSSVNYLYIRSIFNVSDQILIAELVVFSVFALAATAAIVANLVIGIVISGFREIGIMKAVGFTPLQVVSVFVLQVLIPAAAACVLGIPAGSVLAQPILADSSNGLGLAYQPTFSAGLDLVALAGALLIAAVAAIIPALRAGLLKPAVVIASALAPAGRSGRWLRSLASRARLPRAAALGLGDAVARPVRSLLTLLAILVAVATFIVALGETRSFAGIYDYEGHTATVDALVGRSPALSDATATQLIDSQPETARDVAEASINLSVPRIADPVTTFALRGDSGALGYQVTAGRWLNGPGEVVATKGLMQDAHLKLGDRFDAGYRAARLPVRIVGEVYDFLGGPGGHELIVDWSTISAADPNLGPSTYFVTLKPGSNVAAYVSRLAAAQPDLLDVRVNGVNNTSAIGLSSVVLFAIAAVLALIAGGSIFNTMLLNTRERVRDTATLKALGMSPREVIVMVTSTAGFIAVVGGLAAVPVGVAINRLLFDAVVGGFGGVDIPGSAYGRFAPWELVGIPLAGVAVAVAAALIPGRWAARVNVVEALHAE